MGGEAERAALVTGAGAGIGRATALALAAQGFRVLLNDVVAAAVERLAGEIEAAGGHALAAPADIADDEQVAALIDRAERDGKGLTALVHCAGLFPKLSFRQGSLAELDRVMAVNFRASVAMAKAAAPRMQRRGGGAMVFMTSGGGLLGAVADPMQADFSFYGASKAALDRWALGVAAELSGMGVTVNTVCPGAFVLTPGVMALGLKESGERASIPPEAVAEALAWLAGRPDGGPIGQRLVATEFGQTWGPRRAA